MTMTAIDSPPGRDQRRETALEAVADTQAIPPRIASSPIAVECGRLMTVERDHGRALALGQVVVAHIPGAAALAPERCYTCIPALDLIGRLHGAGRDAPVAECF